MGFLFGLVGRHQHQDAVTHQGHDDAVARLELRQQELELVADMLGRGHEVEVLEIVLLGHDDHVVLLVPRLEEDFGQLFDIPARERQARQQAALLVFVHADQQGILFALRRLLGEEQTGPGPAARREADESQAEKQEQSLCDAKPSHGGELLVVNSETWRMNVLGHEYTPRSHRPESELSHACRLGVAQRKYRPKLE